jgi:dihydrofolate reductase
MRKLKLQMQITIDGYVAGPNGELDWMTWDWSDDIKKYVDELTDTVDTILLGRKMTHGFVSHWENITKNPDDEGFEFAKKMVNYPKYVFSKTLDKSEGINTEVAKGNLKDEVNRLKNNGSKDIIVYGGAGFVNSLIKENLIDEYYLFVNPIATGKGMTITEGTGKPLKLEIKETKPFDCGIVMNKYIPVDKP